MSSHLSFRRRADSDSSFPCNSRIASANIFLFRQTSGIYVELENRIIFKCSVVVVLLGHVVVVVVTVTVTLPGFHFEWRASRFYVVACVPTTFCINFSQNFFNSQFAVAFFLINLNLFSILRFVSYSLDFNKSNLLLVAQHINIEYGFVHRGHLPSSAS